MGKCPSFKVFLFYHLLIDHTFSLLNEWNDLTRTWDDYAAAIEASFGSSINRNYVPRDQLKKDFDAEPGIGAFVRLLIADKLYDYSENHNELLNPGEKYFKRQSIAEYFKESPVRPAALWWWVQ